MSPESIQIDVLLAKGDEDGNNMISLGEFQNLLTSSEAQPSRYKRALYAVADGIITPAQRIEVHSYLDEYTLCPPPIFIVLISLIEVAIFFAYYFSTTTTCSLVDCCAGCYVHGHIGPLIFAPKERSQAWRFVTYMFLHAGLPHLLGNVIMQLLVGVSLEVVHKIWRIAPIYLLAVVTGSLLQYAMDPRVLLVGASAGVYALITAHLANVFLNWSEMPYRWVRLCIVSVFLSYDLGFAIYRRFFAEECDLVSHWAHLAGGFTGFFFGVIVLYNIVDHSWEKILRYISFVLYGLFVIFIIIMTIIQTPDSAPLINLGGGCKEN